MTPSTLIPLTDMDQLQLSSSSTTGAGPTTTRKPTSSSNTMMIIPDVEIVTSLPALLPTVLRNTYLLLRHGLSTANVDAIISSNRYDLAYTDRHGLTEMGYEQGRQAAQQVMDHLVSSSSSSLAAAAASSNDEDVDDDADNNGENDDSNDNNNRRHHSSVVFVSSPFARARQTAVACQEELRRRLTSSSSPLLLRTTTRDDQQQQPHQWDVEETIYLHAGLMERSFGRLDGQAIETYAYVWPLDAFNVTHTAFDVESVAAVCHRFRQCLLDLEATFQDQIIVLTSHADVLQIAQLYAAGAANVGTFSSYRFQSTLRFVVFRIVVDCNIPSLASFAHTHSCFLVIVILC
jgi:broad specificity phosphatase PhoE